MRVQTDHAHPPAAAVDFDVRMNGPGGGMVTAWLEVLGAG